jgi:hypothetical protein
MSNRREKLVPDDDFTRIETGKASVYHDGHADSEAYARKTGEAVDEVLDEAREALVKRGVDIDRILMVVSKDVNDGVVNGLGVYPVESDDGGKSMRGVVEMALDAYVAILRGHYEGEPWELAAKVLRLKARSNGVEVLRPTEARSTDWKQGSARARGNRIETRIASMPLRVEDAAEIGRAHERIQGAMSQGESFDISAGCAEVGVNPEAMALMAQAYMEGGHPEATGNGDILHAAGVTSGFLLGVAFEQERRKRAES